MSLNEKVGVTQARTMEWYIHYNKKCYVSFSGGKDSTVLAYIAAQVCYLFQCKLVLWFSDTGLEFKELSFAGLIKKIKAKKAAKAVKAGVGGAAQ